MSESGYLFRGPRSTPGSRAGRPPEPRTETRPGMVIDRDVAVLTGSGATIWVDVYRPAGGGAAAPIVGWTPYGKHNPAHGLLYPGGREGSVDVQHGFAADAAAEQGVDRLGGLAPGAFQLHLGVEAAACGQGAQARQIAGPAGVRGELVGEVQRVDPRPMERGRSPWPGR